MSLIAMTVSDIQKFIAFGDIEVSRIHGWNNQGSDLYIQLHQKIPDSIATPLAAGNVPVFKSLLAQANNGFVYSFNPPLCLNQLVVGISTTEVNFTAASNGVDMTLDVQSLFLTNGGETITGDLVTGVSGRNPWTDSVANVAKRLLRVDYVNNDGATRFLLLSTDAGTTNIPNYIYQVANGATLVVENFTEGLQTFTQDGTFTPHYGCQLLQSTTSGVAGATATNASFIKALWR